MRKLKIYLDTSVISHLDAPDVSDKMNDTLALWEDIKSGLYEVTTSDVALREVGNCKEPKQSTLFDYLSEIEYECFSITDEAELLANEIIKQGILTQKSFDDCLHIAIAVINNCDIILSWNFKHMVNIKTINGVRAVNILNGYKSIDIYSPTILIKGDDIDE